MQNTRPSPTDRPRHWAEAFINKPWVLGGEDMSGFDCWGLVRFVYRTRYGIELPSFGVSEDVLEVARQMRMAERNGQWFPLLRPLDGCAVAMSSHKSTHHVGIYLAVDGGMVLHACQGKGVLAQSPNILLSQGWAKVDYYLHHKWPTSSA